MLSFVHFAFLDFSSTNGLIFLRGPEVGNKLLIFSVGDIKFSGLVVFELRVINHFLGNSLSSEEPDSFNIKIGLISNDDVHSEGVFSKVINSLEETIHEIAGLIEDFSFSGVLIILKMIDAVSIIVVVIPEELETCSFLVFVVDEESLEVI